MVDIELEKSLERTLNLSNNLFLNGFCVVDNIFSNNRLKNLYNEVELLHNSKWLEPSGNILQCLEGEIVRLKPNVYERSLVMKNEVIAGLSTMNLIPTLSEFWYQRELITEIITRQTGIRITSLDQIKVAAIEEGGSFMIHTDKMPNTNRILTMTLYLNNTKEEFHQEEGGHLRIYPLINQIYPHIIDISPIFGRAVFFSSTNLPHRVLSSKSSSRYCISFFFYGESYFPLLSIPSSTNSSNNVMNLTSTTIIETTESMLLQHYIIDSQLCLILERFRRDYSDLSSIIYQDESCRSIYESFSIHKEEENGDVDVDDDDSIVKSAVQQFNQKCYNYYNTLEDSLKVLVDLVILFNEQNKLYQLIE